MAFDAEERGRFEGLIQDALRGATIADAAVTVYANGSIGVEWIEARLKDGLVIGVLPPECGEGEVTIRVCDGDEQREMTLQSDFLPSDYYGEDRGRS